MLACKQVCQQTCKQVNGFVCIHVCQQARKSIDYTVTDPSIINLLTKKHKKRLYTLTGKASEDIRHPQSSKTPVQLSSPLFASLLREK